MQPHLRGQNILICRRYWSLELESWCETITQHLVYVSRPYIDPGGGQMGGLF